MKLIKDRKKALTVLGITMTYILVFTSILFSQTNLIITWFCFGLFLVICGVLGLYTKTILIYVGYRGGISAVKTTKYYGKSEEFSWVGTIVNYIFILAGLVMLIIAGFWGLMDILNAHM